MARRTKAQANTIAAAIIQQGLTEVSGNIATDVVPTPLVNGVEETSGPHVSAEKFEQLVSGASPNASASDRYEMDADPDDIAVDEEIKAIRAWTEGGIWAKGHGTQQEMQLGELARTIYEEGQRQSCGAFIHNDVITLWDGVRRREAIKIIREEGWKRKLESGEEVDFQLRVSVDTKMTRDQAIRAALLTFTQHEGLTPRERAKVIAFLRRKYDWGGKEGTSERAEGTAKIAEYLGVSPATVTNDERLAQAPTELQDLVECGRMTMTTALESISATGDLPKEDRSQAQAKIATRAKEMAEEEAKTNPPKRERAKLDRLPTAAMNRSANEMKKEIARRKERARQDDAAQGTGEDESTSLRAEESQDEASHDEPEIVDAPATVERRHVKAAAREVLGDKAKTKAPLMRDAIELIEQWCGPAYPPVMRSWADAFVEYGHGKLAPAKLEAAWDRISDALLSGKKPVAVSKPAKPTKGKPTKGKATAKKGGKK